MFIYYITKFWTVISTLMWTTTGMMSGEEQQGHLWTSNKDTFVNIRDAYEYQQQGHLRTTGALLNNNKGTNEQ